ARGMRAPPSWALALPVLRLRRRGGRGLVLALRLVVVLRLVVAGRLGFLRIVTTGLVGVTRGGAVRGVGAGLVGVAGRRPVRARGRRGVRALVGVVPIVVPLIAVVLVRVGLVRVGPIVRLPVPDGRRRRPRTRLRCWPVRRGLVARVAGVAGLGVVV